MAATFAELLRRFRVASGLTQEVLAERAGLSVNAIQKLERGGTRPYRHTVDVLIGALDLDENESVAFRRAGQPAPRTHDTSSSALPRAPTSFVGREREIGQVRSLLPSGGVLSLTGVGGCGKSRLALEVARLCSSDYADGVRLIELASLADPALVPHTIASALGIRESPTQPLTATIVAALRSRRMLLLLDNCEHLLDACAQFVDAVVRSCPAIQILVTSRERLTVDGEIEIRVPSLPVDAAVRLFVDRARSADPSFVLSSSSAPPIETICARLDGLPLAVELAAALVRALSVEDIAKRLDQRFALLSGGSRTGLARHRTLRATLDWSYDLLTKSEQLLFARLSVFLGHWTAEAAEVVCSGGDIERTQIIGLLVRLVDKSLVIVDVEGRFYLLDSVLHYAHQLGFDEAVQRRHALYFLEFAEQADLGGPSQSKWMERLSIVHTDLLQAVEWFVAHNDIQLALRLAAVLSRFWEVRGYVGEGRERLAKLLALPSEPTIARADVLLGAGVLALYQGDLLTTRVLIRESLAVYRLHRDDHGIAWALIYLGWMCDEQGRERAARRLLEQALALCRQHDDERGTAMCLNVLGLVAMCDQTLEAAEHARALHEECIMRSRAVGDRWGTAWALTNLACDLTALAEMGRLDPHAGDACIAESKAIWRELGERRHLAFSNGYEGRMAIVKGDAALARSRFEDSLATFDDLADTVGLGLGLRWWAYLYTAEGRFEDAARMLGAAAAWMSRIGKRYTIYDWIMNNHLNLARDSLGQVRADALWHAGRSMSLDEARTYLR